MLPTETNEQIMKLISDRAREKVEYLKFLEEDLKKIRGYVFNMPSKGSSVVVEMSGGADSTITTAMLMEEFGLEVYPFFVNRGQRSFVYEKESIAFFSELYKKKYAKLFHEPKELTIPNPATEIKSDLTEKLRHNIGHPMRNSILTEYGVQYAYSLENKGIHARTIFSSVVSSDANYLYHSTLTALRSQMLHIIIDMGDISWQVSALPIEKELGLYFDKPVIIKWADEHDIPVEKTRTCVELTDIQCGVCVMCYNRKRSFIDAGVVDKTEYIDKRSPDLFKPKEEV